MVGTVLAWATLESTGSLWLAFIVARLIGFVVGAFIQRTVIQPIRVRAARRMTCMFTPLPQSQVSDLDQGPANRSRRVNLSPCSEREQSLPRTEMRDDTPDGRPCRPRKHLRNQREQTLSNRASGPCSRHHHSLFARADEEVLYRECFSIVLIVSLGPFQPRNLIYCLQERWWLSKNFSSSSTARTGRCRMSCKSPSKGARSGSVELHRLCPLFADRTQEDGKQTVAVRHTSRHHMR